jgi:hypothetical protein
MKRLILVCLSIILCLGDIMAQTSPTGINYQAVARGTDGTELANHNLDVQFSILQGGINGTVVWEEVHSTTTNNFGVFNLIIGQGSRIGGTLSSFASIDWSQSTYYLKTEVKFGDSFQLMGTTQMTWVPFALYALKSGSSSKGSDSDSTNELQTLSLQGNTLQIMHGGKVDGSVTLADNDATNELQELSYDAVNEHLMLSKSNTVIDLLHLKNDADSDPTNEIQDLYETHDTIYLTRLALPRKIDLSQKLTLTGNKLSIKRGNTITLDGDTTNEIQDLKLTNDKLTITRNAAATSIDLSPYKDNTDNQTLSLSSSDSVLNISGGNSLKVSSLVNVPWTGFSTVRSNDFEVTAQDQKKILWETIEFNDNNCFSNTYNALVAPQTGVYEIQFGMKFSKGSTELRVCKLVGTTETIVRLLYPENNDNISGNMLIKLDQNDQLYLTVKNNNAAGASNTLWITQATFSGYRVH